MDPSWVLHHDRLIVLNDYVFLFFFFRSERSSKHCFVASKNPSGRINLRPI